MYIKREDAIKILGKLSREPYYQHEGEDYYVGIAEATGEIVSMPSVEIEPVKYAHWEWYEHAYDWNLGGYVCSNCRMKNDNLPGFNKEKLDPYMFAGSKFCPCCGSHMVKENQYAKEN